MTEVHYPIQITHRRYPLREVGDFSAGLLRIIAVTNPKMLERFLEFFSVPIRKPNNRRAYARRQIPEPTVFMQTSICTGFERTVSRLFSGDPT